MKHPLCPHVLHYEGVPCFTCKAISAAESAVRLSEVEPLVEALDKDGCLTIQIGNLEAIAWRLKKGDVNGGISADALANQLLSIAHKLNASDLHISAHRARKEARNET